MIEMTPVNGELCDAYMMKMIGASVHNVVIFLFFYFLTLFV
jgi:hypothetical protein